MDGPVRILPSTENDPNHWSSALKCTICMEYFSDPQCLPCGHTFCRSCIESVIEHMKNMKNLPNNRDNRVTFSCPHCRRRIHENSYKKFSPKNVVVESIVETWHNSPQCGQLKTIKAESETQTDTNDSLLTTKKIKPNMSDKDSQTVSTLKPQEEMDAMLQLKELGNLMSKQPPFAGFTTAAEETPSLEETLYALQDNLLPGDNFTFGEYQLVTLPETAPSSEATDSLIHMLNQIFTQSD